MLNVFTIVPVQLGALPVTVIVAVPAFTLSVYTTSKSASANVDVTFLTKKGDEEKYIHYSGDAKTFKESFEKIDLNKMWGNNA